MLTYDTVIDDARGTWHAYLPGTATTLCGAALDRLRLLGEPGWSPRSASACHHCRDLTRPSRPD